MLFLSPYQANSLQSKQIHKIAKTSRMRSPQRRQTDVLRFLVAHAQHGLVKIQKIHEEKRVRYVDGDHRFHGETLNGGRRPVSQRPQTERAQKLYTRLYVCVYHIVDFSFLPPLLSSDVNCSFVVIVDVDDG